MSGVIPFTQFMRPDGRRRATGIDVADDVAGKARKLIADGLTFQCEVLVTGEASFTITDPSEGDLDIRVVPNGPGVREAIEEMVRQFPSESAQ